MVVPYMLVRKTLATPRESTYKGSLLLMDCFHMLVQIGFLQFKVPPTPPKKKMKRMERFAIYWKEIKKFCETESTLKD